MTPISRIHRKKAKYFLLNVYFFFSECPKDKWGVKCLGSCSQCGSYPCHVHTGGCDGGCKVGFYGHGTCDKGRHH